MEIGNSDSINSQFGVQRLQENKANNNELDQEDFLQLMVAQIQNQDPFEPVDNGEFIADLAQFSSVDGINSLVESFDQFVQTFNGNQALDAAALIGKSVEVEGNQLSLKQDEPVTAYVDGSGQVGTALVEIRNSAGVTIQTKEVPLINGGLNSFTWDGLNADGQPQDEGFYFISASVLSGENEVALSTTVQSKVESVNLSNSSAIELGLETGGTILFNEVQKISQ